MVSKCDWYLPLDVTGRLFLAHLCDLLQKPSFVELFLVAGLMQGVLLRMQLTSMSIILHSLSGFLILAEIDPTD